jgi:hypothetical protein
MTFTSDELQAMNKGKTKPTAGQPFTPKPKGDRPNNSATATTEAIPQARESAIALTDTSHAAMSALQQAGLANAAAYVQRKTADRSLVIEKVSNAIAYLSDPDILEADIFAAAAEKVEARSNAWEYAEPVVDFDNLFALPSNSQRLLGGV